MKELVPVVPNVQIVQAVWRITEHEYDRNGIGEARALPHRTMNDFSGPLNVRNFARLLNCANPQLSLTQALNGYGPTICHF